LVLFAASSQMLSIYIENKTHNTMLVIRMQRTGRKNQATFRLVLQEKSQAPRSAAKEILGSYNPHAKERKDQVRLQDERIKYWLSVGAQASPTVHNMLIEFGVTTGKKVRVVQPKLKPQAEGAEAEAKTETPAAEKTEEKKEEKPAEAPAEEKAA